MKVFSIWRCTGSAGVRLSVESGKDTNGRLCRCSLPSPARRFGWRSRCTAGPRERRRPSPTVCLSGPMRFRDARLPEWDTARSGSLTRRKLPLLPSLDGPSPWTGWFRWNHRNKGGTSRPCFSRTTEKQKATAFAVAFCFGGERGIRIIYEAFFTVKYRIKSGVFPLIRYIPYHAVKAVKGKNKGKLCYDTVP